MEKEIIAYVTGMAMFGLIAFLCFVLLPQIIQLFLYNNPDDFIFWIKEIMPLLGFFIYFTVITIISTWVCLLTLRKPLAKIGNVRAFIIFPIQFQLSNALLLAITIAIIQLIDNLRQDFYQAGLADEAFNTIIEAFNTIIFYSIYTFIPTVIGNFLIIKYLRYTFKDQPELQSFDHKNDIPPGFETL